MTKTNNFHTQGRLRVDAPRNAEELLRSTLPANEDAPEIQLETVGALPANIAALVNSDRGQGEGGFAAFVASQRNWTDSAAELPQPVQQHQNHQEAELPQPYQQDASYNASYQEALSFVRFLKGARIVTQGYVSSPILDHTGSASPVAASHRIVSPASSELDSLELDSSELNSPDLISSSEESRNSQGMVSPTQSEIERTAAGRGLPLTPNVRIMGPGVHWNEEMVSPTQSEIERTEVTRGFPLTPDARFPGVRWSYSQIIGSAAPELDSPELDSPEPISPSGSDSQRSGSPAAPEPISPPDQDALVQRHNQIIDEFNPVEAGYTSGEMVSPTQSEIERTAARRGLPFTPDLRTMGRGVKFKGVRR